MDEEWGTNAVSRSPSLGTSVPGAVLVPDLFGRNRSQVSSDAFLKRLTVLDQQAHTTNRHLSVRANLRVVQARNPFVCNSAHGDPRLRGVREPSSALLMKGRSEQCACSPFAFCL
jgi:hypothetical protein